MAGALRRLEIVFVFIYGWFSPLHLDFQTVADRHFITL
jgi:hypothetical protein